MADDKFRQWYPHHIDRWLGSANVAALTHAGYRGVHNLLMYQWQQIDGMLPEGIDDKTLAKQSRLNREWTEFRDEVLEFFPMAPNGRRFNVRNFIEWQKASQIFDTKVTAARVANDARWNGRRKKDSPQEPKPESTQGSLLSSDASGMRDASVTDTTTLLTSSTKPNQTKPNITTREFAENGAPDLSKMALRIACAHPKSRLKMLKPIEVGSFEQRSIFNAIVAEASANNGSMEMAAEYILSTVEQITKETPADQVRYVPDVAKFFDNREYRKPTNSWSGRNGANSGRFGTNTDRTISGLADFLGADALPKVDSSTARGASDGAQDNSIEAGLPAFHGGVSHLRESGHPRGGKGNVIDATL